MQETDIKAGDAIFFNTGWGRLWMKNNDRFNSGEPGIGLEIAHWVIDKDLALTGADTWAVEVVPNPDKGLAFIVHQELQTKHGIVKEPGLRRPDRRPEIPVCVRLRPGADQRRYWVERLPDRNDLIARRRGGALPAVAATITICICPSLGRD